MKRKLITGAIVITLVLTAGIGVYAATNSQEKGMSDGTVYQEEVSMTGEGAVSFDEVDKDDLPEGVIYMDEVSGTDENAQNLPLGE